MSTRDDIYTKHEKLEDENERLRAALADKSARLEIALGVLDDHDEARTDYESLVEHAEDAVRG